MPTDKRFLLNPQYTADKRWVVPAQQVPRSIASILDHVEASEVPVYIRRKSGSRVQRFKIVLCDEGEGLTQAEQEAVMVHSTV